MTSPAKRGFAALMAAILLICMTAAGLCETTDDAVAEDLAAVDEDPADTEGLQWLFFDGEPVIVGVRIDKARVKTSALGVDRGQRLNLIACQIVIPGESLIPLFFWAQLGICGSSCSFVPMPCPTISRTTPKPKLSQ